MKESKSQRKRKAYNYRTEYFKRNPGLFGCVWFCSQCGIPLFGRENVQVDHIIPLAGAGINRTINTVAICPKCNREKSDKGGKYIVRGEIAKLFEVILFTIQKLFLYILVGILCVFNFIKNKIISILFAPFKGTSSKVQIIALCVYSLIILWILYSVI